MSRTALWLSKFALVCLIISIIQARQLHACSEEISSSKTAVRMKNDIEKRLNSSLQAVEIDESTKEELYLIEILSIKTPAFWSTEADFFGVLGLGESYGAPEAPVIVAIHEIGATLISESPAAQTELRDEGSAEGLHRFGLNTEIRVPFKVKGTLKQIHQVLNLEAIMKARTASLEITQ